MPNIVPQDECPKCNEKGNEAHYSLHKQQVEPCEACVIRLLEQVHSLFKAQVASQQTKTQIGDIIVSVNSLALGWLKEILHMCGFYDADLKFE